ncbi:MAG: hypothetical protein RL367_1466, partial [Pseudomonadota bacterium]
MEKFDVLIVGAGISGIGGAVHLTSKCPGKSFAILEGRAAIGGTWDLFKYPGIRSDSDMHTLGFEFKPWTDAKAIADAPAIKAYLQETADEYDLRRHIRFHHQVTQLDWSSTDACWSVTCETGEDRKPVTLQANFLFMGTGYYSYTDPYRPEFAGQGDFKGPVIHPQFWPEHLDYQGKRVVIIGSGATAVTLVPAMAAGGAGHVTMLQRSPSYIVSRPARDRIANILNRTIPLKLAYRISRAKNIWLSVLLFKRSRAQPDKVRDFILNKARATLGQDYDVATHLTPRYDPWDERMCLIPDNDMFVAMAAGQAAIVTGQIDRFTATGIRLENGSEVPADIIVTATGLRMEIMSGVTLCVDGQVQNLGEHLSYKGFMYSDIPNIISSFGYSNASWTLKSDLIGHYMCRLLNHMDLTATSIATPRPDGVTMTADAMLNLKSGYVKRALAGLPKQGDREPWKAHHNYFVDRKNL